MTPILKSGLRLTLLESDRCDRGEMEMADKSMPMQQSAEQIERECGSHDERGKGPQSLQVRRDPVELVAEDVSEPHIACRPQPGADRVQTDEHEPRKTSGARQWRGHGIE